MHMYCYKIRKLDTLYQYSYMHVQQENYSYCSPNHSILASNSGFHRFVSSLATSDIAVVPAYPSKQIFVEGFHLTSFLAFTD